MEITLLVCVIVIALVFEFINGFHDSANSIATVVSTKVLTPKQAIIMAGTLDFVGAFTGTYVAKTIGAGIVDTSMVTQYVIISALGGAIIWNLLTWFLGLPSSSSHALIGGLLGAAITSAGFGVVQLDGLYAKVLIPMVSSPLIGFVAGFLLMIFLLHLFAKSAPERLNKYFKKMQLASSAVMALSHGSNDAQKTMGIITLALFSHGALSSFEVPTWVIAVCAITMGLGTMSGGWRIIRTMGSKVIKLKPIHGFAAETTAASLIFTASHLGIPLSTTHTISSSIMGVGSSVRLNAVKWPMVARIIWAWILTIPACALISSAIYLVVKFIFNI